MILLTGVTGLIGGALAQRLLNEGESLTVTVRTLSNELPMGVRVVHIGNILRTTDWNDALQGVEVVVHCAARVHVMQDKASDPLDIYRQVNVEGTLGLARQAAKAGIRRFVFVSSIKVNGEATKPNYPFHAEDIPAPMDPYGVSKMEAEQGLRELSVSTGMEVVIVRPPLVYGPGVKANFASMLRWVAASLPLPLGSINNFRSMVALDNLVDLLYVCIRHPAAAGQTFLVSDGLDVSTTDLLRRTAHAMGKTCMLLPIPRSLLEFVAHLLGQRDLVQRLCGSLQVDIEKTRRVLGWEPPITLDQGLKKAVEGVKQ